MDVSKKSRIIRRLRRLTELTGGGYLSYLDTEAGLNAQTGSWRIPHYNQSPVWPQYLVLTNVMYSCNIEQASRPGGCNIVSVIMNKKGMGLDGVLDWLAEYHGQIMSNFQVQYLIACFHGVSQSVPMSAPVKRLAH
ncbi:hypothetical protein V8E53_011658 [Lactarius tabidus]